MKTVCITATDESASVQSAGSCSARDFLARSLSNANPDELILTKNPEEADIIIFAESHKDTSRGDAEPCLRVSRHSAFKAFTNRCIIHNGTDSPSPTVPGLYPSIPKAWANRLHCVGAPYLAELNPFIDEMVSSNYEPKTLASFMGSCARKPLRIQLRQMAQRPNWSGIDFEDSTAKFIGTLRTNDAAGHERLKRHFVQQIMDSKFTLCPEGAGPSSYRIFESMQCGRAPVIIGNHWTPPPGPDWNRFSITVGSKQLHLLPSILRSREDEWQSMGLLARKQWELYYHPLSIGREIVRLAQLVLDNKPYQRTSRKIFVGLYRVGPMSRNRAERWMARKHR